MKKPTRKKNVKKRLPEPLLDIRVSEPMPSPTVADLMVERERILSEMEFIPFTVEYPDGWWEAFKYQVFPAWAIAKWPVLTVKRPVFIRKPDPVRLPE